MAMDTSKNLGKSDAFMDNCMGDPRCNGDFSANQEELAGENSDGIAYEMRTPSDICDDVLDAYDDI